MSLACIQYGPAYDKLQIVTGLSGKSVFEHAKTFERPEPGDQ